MADYIDREALLAHLYSKQDEPMDVALEIAQFPAADAAPVVHGRWRNWHGAWFCEGCGKGYRIAFGALPASAYSYCPNCGAKMDGKA